jgi:hypothetical protein
MIAQVITSGTCLAATDLQHSDYVVVEVRSLCEHDIQNDARLSGSNGTSTQYMRTRIVSQAGINLLCSYFTAVKGLVT